MAVVNDYIGIDFIAKIEVASCFQYNQCFQYLNLYLVLIVRVISLIIEVMTIASISVRTNPINDFFVVI